MVLRALPEIISELRARTKPWALPCVAQKQKQKKIISPYVGGTENSVCGMVHTT